MQAKPPEMVPVPLETFLPGVPIPVDVFVSLSTEKYVMIFKAGGSLEMERLKNFQGESVEQLHVRKEDYPKLLERQITVAGIIVKNPKVSFDAKASFLGGVNEMIIKEFSEMGFSDENFEAAKNIARAVLSLVNSEPRLLNLLLRLHENQNFLLRHSMGVGLIASMLGKALQWNRQETLEKLALGGLLHDIGKQEVTPAILLKNRAELTYEELKEYEGHAFRGMQILLALEIVPDDVVAIAYEHHENSIGQGYPRRLWDMKINPLSRVVAVANIFVELTLPINGLAKTPNAAIFHIENVMGQPFNKEAFKRLKALVQDLKNLNRAG